MYCLHFTAATVLHCIGKRCSSSSSGSTRCRSFPSHSAPASLFVCSCVASASVRPALLLAFFAVASACDCYPAHTCTGPSSFSAQPSFMAAAVCLSVLALDCLIMAVSCASVQRQRHRQGSRSGRTRSAKGKEHKRRRKEEREEKKIRGTYTHRVIMVEAAGRLWE